MIGHEKKLCNKEKESMKLTLSHTRQKLYSANINFVKNIFMKKLLIGVVLVLITGITAIAQKSSTFIHSDKAIRGFDPVAYFTEAKPVMGSDSLNLEWNNAIWYFASRKNLELFRKNPENYAPQYGGYCAYGLSNGYKAQTDPQAWTIDNGRLYLNYNLNVRNEWDKNRKERIEKADKNWPEVKDKGKE
jgi:hypothetical protein